MSFERIAVAISGSGRSLDNLLRNQNSFRYKVVGVISSNPNCRGTEIAKIAGVPVENFDFSTGNDPNLAPKIEQALTVWGADSVVLAGFLKYWPSITHLRHRVINIHPALLPKFGGPKMYGLNVHNAVISKGELKSGATVHFVDDIYDHGTIISQVEVSVLSGDTAETLSNRVFEAECDVLPKTLDRLASGTLPLKDAEIWRYEFRQSRKL